MIQRKMPDQELVYRRAFSAYQTASKRIGRVFALTYDEFVELSKADCFYCGAPPELRTFNRTHKKTNSSVFPIMVSGYINGIDRFFNRYGYVLENAVSCCWTCNRMKGEMDGTEFLDHVKRIRENEKSRFEMEEVKHSR